MTREGFARERNEEKDKWKSWRRQKKNGQNANI